MDFIQNDYFQLVIGLIILVLSGDYLVKGAVSIARHAKISTLVVGSTVVAFGTSAPELIVSVNAAIGGHPEISLGNVIGSNIANIALVLGVTSIILPMPVKQDSIRVGWPIMMLGSILFYVFASNGLITPIEGIALLVLLIFFIFISLRISRKSKEADEILKPELKILPSILILAFSCIGLGFGANLLVNGASGIATGFGVSERIISITIVAFGTSLPELTASIIAAFKKETDISIGNIIGSNIFNLLGVIGITSTVSPIALDFDMFVFDIRSMLALAAILVLFVYPFGQNWRDYRSGKHSGGYNIVNLKGGILHRWEALILFVLYITYIYSIL